jgi:hypothetical protein
MTGLDKLKVCGEYFRAYSSEAYDDTIRATKKLASTSLLLLQRKTEEERREMLAKGKLSRKY